MRLFLSSLFLGDHADTLVRMTGRSARVALIANALDNFPDFRAHYLEEEVYPLFAPLGFRCELLDLTDYFDAADGLAAHLARFDLVWAIGGNSFLLRRAMRLSGFDAALLPLLADASRVYGGWSAGAVVAGTDLFGIDLMDDASATAPGYPDGEALWEGLGLVDGTLVPHFESDNREAPAAARAVREIERSGRTPIALKDGEVLVREDGASRILPAV